MRLGEQIEALVSENIRQEVSFYAWSLSNPRQYLSDREAFQSFLAWRESSQCPVVEVAPANLFGYRDNEAAVHLLRPSSEELGEGVAQATSTNNRLIVYL
jgi:hypothetical protein